ncbi:MAG: aminotransferase class IV [Acidimicrobiia bacterium]|nr:aminotransferase class IV [Acidimicrobiia bacterium]
MTQPATIWRNGELIPFADATIHVLSHAANRGTEVFDVLRVVETASGPAAVGLRPHVARFDQSMELMGMEPDFDVAGLERAVAETVLANPGSTTVKLLAVWAEVPEGTLPVSRRPSLLVAAVRNERATVGVGHPVKIRTSVMPKIPASILPPSLKVGGSYTAAIRQQLDALEAGFDDIVFRTAEGRLAEGTAQSLLVVDSGRLLAPPLDSVLDGITRRLLLDLARHDGRTIVVGDVHWDQVIGASELLFTSTSAFVRPVARLDDRELPAPGPVARWFGEQLEALVVGEHPLATRWLTPLTALVA